MFASVQSREPEQTAADYSVDQLLNDNKYQREMLAAVAMVALVIEQLVGTAQDIEGVIDKQDKVHIVQTRPQV